MNLRIKKNIESSGFRLMHNSIFVISNNKVYQYNLDFIKKWATKDIYAFQFISVEQNQFIIQSGSGQGVLIDLNNGNSTNLSSMIEDMRFLGSYYQNLFSVHFEKDIFSTPIIGVFDVEKRKLLWKSHECKSDLFKQDIYYGINADILYVNNALDGSFQWSFDFSTLSSYKDYDGGHPAKLVSNVGIYNNILWLHIEYNRLIGLDAQTGKLLHEIYVYKELNLPKQHLIQLGQLHMDTEKGIIKSLSGRYYIEMDLDTNKIEIKKDFGEDSQNSWRISQSTYYQSDNILYFIGARHGEAVNRAVGIFDTNKCEVTWYDEPLEERKFLFFTDVPQVNDKYLGVLDSKNNLRLYERE